MEKYDIKCYKKPSNVPSTYDVISTVFFIIRKGYKGLNNYVWGLKQLVHHVLNKRPQNYYLYVFHDKTIEEARHSDPQLNQMVNTEIRELMTMLRRHNRVFLFRYNFPQFKEDTHPFYHVHTFGTVIRFLPLFDYKEFSHLKTVTVLDIDVVKVLKRKPDKFDSQFTLIEKTPNIPVYFSSYVCYDVLYWSRIQRLNNLTFLRMIANFVGNRSRFPQQLFDTFINKLGDGTAILPEDRENMEYYVSLLRNDTIHGPKKFFFGYDEYFLDAYILPWMIDKRIEFLANLTGKDDLDRSVKSIFKNLEYHTDELKNIPDASKNLLLKVLRSTLQEDIDPTLPLKHVINLVAAAINERGREEMLERFNRVILTLSEKEAKILYLGKAEYRCLKNYNEMRDCKYLHVTYNKKGTPQHDCIKKRIE